MYAVGRLGSYITRGVNTVSGPFHPFGGAVDIIVVEQPDGSFKSSPWYVRFGKFQGVLKARERVVTISVNGVDANFHMYLDQRGQAYFHKEVDGQEDDSNSSSSGDDADEHSQNIRRPMKSKSCNYDGRKFNSDEQIDESNGKVMARSNSHRSKIFGLVFGRRSMKKDGYQDDGAGSISSLERAEIAANLLDVKWSTNLDTSNAMEDNASRVFASNTSDGKWDKHRAGNDGQSQVSLFLQDANETNTDEHSLQIPGQDATAEGLVSDVAHPDKNLGDRWVSTERNVAVTGSEICEERIIDRVQTFLFTEKSENSLVGLDGSKEQSEKALYLTSEEPGEVQSCINGLHVTSKLLPEDRVSQQAEKVELDRLLIESFDNNHEQLDPSSAAICGYSEQNLEVQLSVSESHVQEVSMDPVLGFVKIKSNSISSTSGFSNMEHKIQNVRDKNDLQSSLISVGDLEQLDGESQLTNGVSIPVSENSEEQFLFNDLDDLKHRETEDKSKFPVSDKEDCASSSPISTSEVNGLVSTIDECFSSQGSVLQNNEMVDTVNVGISKVVLSPIYIPKLNSTLDAENRQGAESLPDIMSCIDNEDTEDIKHPLSLGSNFESLDWKMHGMDDSHYINSDTVNQSSPNSNEHDSHHSEDITDGVVNPAVEISLCGHLLYEGMGAEAASQAFDAEKLDIDKLAAIGPTVVKNDRLIVRIHGRYFPWDAAAPIVLGMITFGSKMIFEPKGMIPVDRVEKSPMEDPSNAIVSPGGSWRLWPFSLRRSRSRKATQPVLVETRSFDSGIISERIIVTDNDITLAKPSISKKMVRANIPTSEELASLNLKEGSNVVTFTFSTAMLGRQKVDARIYLWKWNTRIVISDVDGTITKSDVLGQFMPLVGVDWSQTGVAHLFSAIKENGYQLLFLSARAISQAYITRQFLVNLKQDGKALPDGPVVISPDGLFPSLFREVIRRAPHEFKIACLEDIKALFPQDCNPFYAGFGNRDTDEISYLKVGIPKGKIFIINPKGEVAVNRRIDTKSYTSLHDLVHGMFPAMKSSEQEDFNSWNFWRLPPPDIDI